MLNILKIELLKQFTGKKVLVIILAIIGISSFMALGFRAMNALEGAPKIFLSGQVFSVFLLHQLSDTVLPLLMIVLLSGMIAEEYKEGTLKLLLLKPISRHELMLAKMLTSVVMVILILTITLVSGYTIGTLVFGWEGTMEGEQIYMVESIQETLIFYTATALPYIGFSFIILFLSTMFTSTAIVIGASIALYFILSAIASFINILQPFIINTHFFIGQYALGGGVDWANMLPSISIVLVYIAVFMLLNIIIFQRKDILS